MFCAGFWYLRDASSETRASQVDIGVQSPQEAGSCRYFRICKMWQICSGYVSHRDKELHGILCIDWWNVNGLISWTVEWLREQMPKPAVWAPFLLCDLGRVIAFSASHIVAPSQIVTKIQ